MKILFNLRSFVVAALVGGIVFYSYAMDSNIVDTPPVVMGGTENGTMSAESMADMGEGDGELDATGMPIKKKNTLTSEEEDQEEDQENINLDDFGDEDEEENNESCDLDDMTSGVSDSDDEEADDLPVL